MNMDTGMDTVGQLSLANWCMATSIIDSRLVEQEISGIWRK